MKAMRSELKKRREIEMQDNLNNAIDQIMSEGYDVRFGEIGTKTTYALLTKGDEEIVGYTFIRDSRYKNETIGRYNALQQALTRKSLLEQQSADEKK